MKEMIETNGEQSRDLFLSEQNICNMAWKLAKETYKKNENDAQSVRMWVAENIDKVSFIKRPMLRLTMVGVKVAICPSQLEYKQNGNEI
jgi:hypothetical protein